MWGAAFGFVEGVCGLVSAPCNCLFTWFSHHTFDQVSLLRLHFNINSHESSSGSSTFDGVIDSQLFDDVCILKSLLSYTRKLPFSPVHQSFLFITIFMFSFFSFQPSSLTYSLPVTASNILSRISDALPPHIVDVLSSAAAANFHLQVLSRIHPFFKP